MKTNLLILTMFEVSNIGLYLKMCTCHHTSASSASGSFLCMALEDFLLLDNFRSGVGQRILYRYYLGYLGAH